MKKTLWLSFLLIVCMILLTACGETAGKSAYEIAVENGFEGTESEWLDSLKGKDGKDGTNGTDGVDGANGIDGADGKDSAFSLHDYYDAAVEAGYEGSYLDFITTKSASLQLTRDDVAIVSQNLLASVSIVSTFPIQYQAIDMLRGLVLVNDTATTYGSGFIYRIDRAGGDAYVITNYHVVYNAKSTTGNKISDNINVVLYGYSTDSAIRAEFVGGSSFYDIALLKIVSSEVLTASEAASVAFADSNEVTAGQTAVAIGNGGGNGIAVTKGIVSVDSEKMTLRSNEARVMRVDCAINEGNSGGGVFDSDGRLIGVVNAKQESSAVDNVAYAIPSNVARYVVENLLYYRERENEAKVKKCVLGITMVDADSYAHYDGSTGKTHIFADVTVDAEDGIDENALAYGTLQNGDIIRDLKVDRAGTEEGFEETYVVRRSFAVVDLMLTMRVGDKVRFTIVRGGEETQADLTMTEDCIEVCP